MKKREGLAGKGYFSGAPFLYICLIDHILSNINRHGDALVFSLRAFDVSPVDPYATRRQHISLSPCEAGSSVDHTQPNSRKETPIFYACLLSCSLLRDSPDSS